MAGTGELRGKAAVFVAPRKFEIMELPAPPVEDGGILVKVTAAGLCGSDLHYWRGEMRPFLAGRPGPFILGHEMIGRVHTLKGVSTDSLGNPLKEGDRVVFPYYFPCYRCYQCTRGELNHCPNRFRFRFSIEDYPYASGGFADFFYLPPQSIVFKVPDGLPDEVLTPVNCALAQVIYALEKGNVRVGDAVVVQGAGGLGLYAVAAAKEMGAGLIIAIDGVPARLELAKQCGADEVININEITEADDRVARVRELCGTRGGADVVLELVGYPQVVPEGLQMVRKGGTYVEVGNIWPESNVTVDMSKILFGMVNIVPTAHYHPFILARALDFIFKVKDRYPITNIVSHKFPLEKINEAFEQSEWIGKQGQLQVTRAIIVP